MANIGSNTFVDRWLAIYNNNKHVRLVVRQVFVKNAKLASVFSYETPSV